MERKVQVIFFKKAGCWLMALGVESGNDEIQKMIKKGTTRTQARETVKLCKKFGILEETMVGYNYFSSPAIGTMHVSKDELIKMRKKALRSIYLNPRYITNTLIRIRNPKELINYTRLVFV